MKLVVLTGIPGSGSTTVLGKALEEVDHVHLNYGDIMTEIAIKEKLVDDRDALRKLPAETQKAIFLPGLPIWVLEQLQPDQFILIEAHPDEIIYRRLNDDTRERDLQKVKEIELHQQMNRATSMAYATLTGATVKIIANHDNHLKSTVNKLVNVLKL